MVETTKELKGNQNYLTVNNCKNLQALRIQYGKPPLTIRNIHQQKTFRNTSVIQKFTLQRLYNITEAVQAVNIPAAFRSIVGVRVLILCALFHFACDLKATKYNLQCRLIWELTLF